MMKNIWIIKTAEPVPSDGKNVRLMRAGTIAFLLAKKGHNITWWNANINHQQKTLRYKQQTTVKQNENLKIVFLDSLLYKKSVSFKRIISQHRSAKAFAFTAEKLPVPDGIFCCMPTIEIAHEAVKYGKKHTIPVIIDIRDLWPDSFIRFSPKLFRPAFRNLLTPYYRKLQTICSDATVITGITKEFVGWGLGHAKRERTDLDRSFPFAYPETIPDKLALDEADQKWGLLEVGKNQNEFIALFLGFFGRHFEIETVLAAAEKLQPTGKNIKFILCGIGDRLEKYRKMASGLENVVFPGWINAAEIWSIMRKSKVGLAPYRQSETLVKNLPNKPVEYFSAGLPVISSLKGVLERKLQNNDCGTIYEHGDSSRLAEILSELYDNPDRLKKMSENAESLFKRKYSAEKVYQEMANHIENICTRK